MTDIQKNIRENQDSKKEREKNSRIVEIKAICIGAALILAGGAAGGYALNEVKAEREKAQAEAREQAEREKAADEQRKAMEEEEASKTPEEKKAEQIAAAKEEAKEEGCPDEIISLVDKNDELIDFVKDYAQNKDKEIPDTVEGPTEEGQIPHYLQWDERWGYASYGTSIIASSGCGPTCMSMVIVGLTGDVTATPYRMAKYSEERGYIDESNNTYWAMLESAASDWGLRCQETMLDESSLAAELQAGHPVVCSMLPGDFTDVGHFLVLTGYKDGKVTLNDPFSKANSEKEWVFADIQDQIRQMWVFSLPS